MNLGGTEVGLLVEEQGENIFSVIVLLRLQSAHMLIEPLI